MVNRLSLHTTLDPDVPFAHEATLAPPWRRPRPRDGSRSSTTPGTATATSARLRHSAPSLGSSRAAPWGALRPPEAPSRALFCAERLAEPWDFERTPVRSVRRVS